MHNIYEFIGILGSLATIGSFIFAIYVYYKHNDNSNKKK